MSMRVRGSISILVVMVDFKESLLVEFTENRSSMFVKRDSIVVFYFFRDFIFFDNSSDFYVRTREELSFCSLF